MSRNLPIIPGNGHHALPFREEPDFYVKEPPPRSGLHFNDILFMLFRHKRLIIFCGLAGLLAAAAVYFFFPPIYESNAKLFVRYVLDKNAYDLTDPQIKVPNPVNDTVIGSEIEILNSEDLARAVAEALGVGKLLPKSGMHSSLEDATQVISKSLQVSPVKGTSIIGLSFTSTDPKIPEPVLKELVQRYFDKHLEVHRSTNAFKFVAQETDQLRNHLNQIDGELKGLKDKAGIISLAESKTALALETGKIQQDLDSAEADYAAQQSRLNAFAVNAEETEKEHPEATPTPPSQPPPGDVIHHYQALTARLNHLQELESDLLSKYTDQNPLVKTKSAQVAAVQKDLQGLEKKYPALIGTALAGAGTGPAKPDLLTEGAQLVGVQSKMNSLKTHLNELKTRTALLDEVGPRIEQLEREREVVSENYKHSDASLEKARIDETLDPSRIPNISVVEAPTPAEKSKRDFLKKFILVLAGGGFAIGLGISLIIELVFDRSIKRSLELEQQLRIPVLLTIPDIGRTSRRLQFSNSGDELVPQTEGALLAPFCEVIRDRLSIFFELNNMAQKPKLVAVIGLEAEAGASTLAEGLAEAIGLGENKVHLFNKMPSPKRFYNALSDFKESDLDYVVFDMPPAEAMSSTVSLAGFMDAVLLVVEAEKSNRAAVKRAYAELAEKTKVLVVFNKSKSYGPRWLEAEV